MKTGEPVESLSLSKILVLYMRKYLFTYGFFYISSLSCKTSSQEGINAQPGYNLGSSPEGRQASIPLPRESTTSQESSTSPNNIPSRGGHSEVGNNPPQAQFLLRQAGR